MPTLRFAKERPPVEVDSGVTLMDALLAAGLPVASSCRGDGVCGKCRVRVVAGAANLSPESPLEDRLRQRHRIPPDHRVSCQATITGDVTLDASYW